MSVNRVPMKDVVVVLPGIMGSVLQKDGKDIWNVSSKAVSRVLNPFGSKLQGLKLMGDDPEGGDIEDGVKPTRLITDAYLIPAFSGFGKVVDGYNRLSAQISENFTDVIEGNLCNDPDQKAANLYHFPYDWRRDNRANAHILKRLLDKRLQRWQESSGNESAKVVLLAHSMGGLISRYYLEVLGGWKVCKALFTFGTPYRGSLDALNIFANGMKKGRFDVGAYLGLDEVVPTLTSAYQLLPRYRALQVDSDYYRISQSPVAVPGVEAQKAIAALAFHDAIDDAADANKKNASYRSAFVTCPIVGVLQPTNQSAKLIDGVVSISEDLPDWLSDRAHLGDGDGTVPQVSATPVQMNDIEALSVVDYIAEGHAALQNQPDVLVNLLKGIQSTQTASLGDVRGAIKGVARGTRNRIVGIGLTMDDLFLAEEAITLRAKVSGTASFDSVMAEIHCLSAERPVITQKLLNDNGVWRMAMEPLDAGLYKVKVKIDNTDQDAPNPVHSLFSVMDLGE